ncbi:MAG TPA: hypothetical protein VH186_29020 [Chloroflexia bacterium]|nr:hypothetical protein [Chloroflexia bacterium]
MSALFGTVPATRLAPLEYRCALDAAMPLMSGATNPLVICNLPPLEGEVRQRLNAFTASGEAAAGLWVEPLADSWQSQLALFSGALPPRAPLAILLSRPLARLLPERRPWQGQPLGLQFAALFSLGLALRRAGFKPESLYGFHSVRSILLNLASGQAARFQRPDLADRLHFAARLGYRSPALTASLATVNLLIARREVR